MEFEYVWQELTDSIRWAIDGAPPSPYGIVGIGIGVPGLINDEGEVLSAPNLKWRKIDLKGRLEQAFQLPIVIENEANAGAIGERSFGDTRHAKNMIYVSAGIGIGVGIIVNNAIYRGFSGFSGEMGHMTIHMEGVPCTCGNRGCWELYASENALLNEAMRRLGDEIEHYGGEPTLDMLITRAEKGDTRVIELFEQVGNYLGVGIANVINTFNPELVMIGNRLSMIQPWIEPSVLNTVEQRSLPYHHRKVMIEFSRLGMKSAAIGAASLAIQAFFAQSKATVKEG